MNTKVAAKVIMVSSILGVFNAAYLIYLYVSNLGGAAHKSFCDISSTVSCSEVIMSPFVKFFGIPFFMIAGFVYPLLAVLGYLALTKKNPKNYFFTIAILSAMGATMNIVFMNNELSFAHAFCILCTICLGLILLNLVMAILGYSKAKN